ncbi:MAG: signal peptidase I [Planctomycetota bacterium]|nr:signal peptidase I [Planctomycetota bacterium]
MSIADSRPSTLFTVKETLTSVVIAFVLAFVARGFVVEAFLIPTGSMAPTLLGQHMKMRADNSGYAWDVGPWDFDAAGNPLAIQGGRSRINPQTNRVERAGGGPIIVTDPMSRAPSTGPTGEGLSNVPLMAGDRIFVLKYLYSIFDPNRFDVAVFKNPRDPGVNYIKRLVGLPGEQVALIDGDVFTRKPTPDDATGGPPLLRGSSRADSWSLPGWQIARKPEIAQRAMWQPVFNSEYTPLDALAGKPGFINPWQGEASDSGWQIARRRSYLHGPGAGTLTWNAVQWPISDAYAYNELPPPRLRPRSYPVSDVAVSFGLLPQSPKIDASVVVTTRGHQFRIGIFQGSRAKIESRVFEATAEWTTLAEGELSSPLPADRVTNLEFWHVDQSLSLWVEGSRVLTADYDWTPAERVQNALNLSMKEVAEGPSDMLTDASRYPQAGVRIDLVSDQGYELFRVSLARDIHYQAAVYGIVENGQPHSRQGEPAMATHPSQTPTLGPDQFFACGDNSPASLDLRLMDAPDPWVSRQFDDDMGVIPRQLLIGRAFFVYFPSIRTSHNLPVPDFGRMRWIW